MKRFISKSQKIGEKGENIACRFLKAAGYSITERNYSKRCGEIDIICSKNSFLHFIEVKTVSCEIKPGSVIHETIIRPEENLHAHKFRRIANTARTYLSQKGIEERKWQIDLVCVLLDCKSKKARVRILENIIM